MPVSYIKDGVSGFINPRVKTAVSKGLHQNARPGCRRAFLPAIDAQVSQGCHGERSPML